MKESVLSFLFACKFMHVINNQNIYHLVKMQKVILIIIPDGIHKLGLKFVGIYIEDRLFLKKCFDLNSDGLGQVRFPQSAISIYQ